VTASLTRQRSGDKGEVAKAPGAGLRNPPVASERLGELLDGTCLNRGLQQGAKPGFVLDFGASYSAIFRRNSTSCSAGN
jgi:hypothetical protein